MFPGQFYVEEGGGEHRCLWYLSSHLILLLEVIPLGALQCNRTHFEKDMVVSNKAVALSIAKTVFVNNEWNSKMGLYLRFVLQPLCCEMTINFVSMRQKTPQQNICYVGGSSL